MLIFCRFCFHFSTLFSPPIFLLCRERLKDGALLFYSRRDDIQIPKARPFVTKTIKTTALSDIQLNMFCYTNLQKKVIQHQRSLRLQYSHERPLNCITKKEKNEAHNGLYNFYRLENKKCKIDLSFFSQDCFFSKLP